MNDELEQTRRELTAANVRIAELDLYAREQTDRALRLGALLEATADALKGTPDPRMPHSTHDLPEWGAKARACAMSCLDGMMPGVGEPEFERFVQAVYAWRELSSRDCLDTAQALAGLDP